MSKSKITLINPARRVSRGITDRSKLRSAADVVAYKTYLINFNPLSNTSWIEKGGQFIGHAKSLSDAKRIIDELVDTVKNPARRKGAAKPKRKSQSTKKAPTKRLVTRRKKNVKKGYFPNPPLPLAWSLQGATNRELKELSAHIFKEVKAHGKVNVAIIHEGVLNYIHVTNVLSVKYAS